VEGRRKIELTSGLRGDQRGIDRVNRFPGQQRVLVLTNGNVKVGKNRLLQ